MAWTDKPTDNQLSAFFYLTQWVLSNKLRRAATDWLKQTATRKDVSDELGRIRSLYIDHKLTHENVVFAGKTWEGFKWEDFAK